MSTFKVNLGQGKQGDLDTSVVAGVSKQRSIYAIGPNGTNRKLMDGETFVDSNYWKRYAYPAMEKDLAFIEVLTDDGYTYSDFHKEENVFTKVTTVTVAAGTTYTLADNQVDFVDLYGGPAVFCQITVAGDEVNMRMNGDSDATMSLTVGTQIFDKGEVTLNSLAFDNSESGAAEATVTILASIRITDKS